MITSLSESVFTPLLIFFQEPKKGDYNGRNLAPKNPGNPENPVLQNPVGFGTSQIPNPAGGIRDFNWSRLMDDQGSLPLYWPAVGSG